MEFNQLENKTLTISVPCYNDAASLNELIHDFQKFLKDNGFSGFNFLIIDDGSTDSTKDTIENLMKVYNNIEVKSHSINLGFGPSFLSAFTLPKSDIVFFVPGDYQFGTDSFDLMYKQMKETNSDIVYGVRAHRKDSIFRKVNSWLYNYCISAIAHRPSKDVNSIILFKSSILKQFKPFSKSAFINAELFLHLSKINARNFIL